MNDKNHFCDWCCQEPAITEREGDKVCKTCAREYDEEKWRKEQEARQLDRYIEALGKVRAR